MYLLFPLMFSQLIVLHKIIGIPPHLFFGTILILLYGKINKKHVMVLIAVIPLFLISAIIESSYMQTLQVFIETVYGYMVAYIFLRIYSNKRLDVFFSRNLIIWLVIIILFLLDYYYLSSNLNNFFTQLTDKTTAGVSTIFTRITIIWGNPNWLSFFYLLLLAIYLDLGERKRWLIVLGCFGVFLLQTKTAIAIAVLMSIFALFSTLEKTHRKFFIFLFILLLGYFIFHNLHTVINLIDFLENSASFTDRNLIFEYMVPKIEYYPNGMLGDNSIASLKEATPEDTVPTILIITKLLGWPLTLLFILKFVNPIDFKNKSINYVNFTLLSFSITQSFLSISGAASLAMFAYFLIYFHSRERG